MTGVIDRNDIDIGIQEERERIILAHLPQVRTIAQRLHRKLPPSISLDELISAGCIGLIAAVDRFDGSRGVTLRTYAEHTIKGAMLDSLRDLDWAAARRHRQRSRLIEHAKSTLAQREHATPTANEVADFLGLCIAEYHSWVTAVDGLTQCRLEHAEEHGGPLNRLTAAESPSRMLERAAILREVADAIDRLPELDRTVLKLYYYSGLRLRDIGQLMGLHESRISQLKQRAILRLGCAVKAVSAEAA